MTNLFQVMTNGKGANKTAELTAICEKITADIFKTVGNNMDSIEKQLANINLALAKADEAEKEVISQQLADALEIKEGIIKAVEDTKVSHDAMDKFIAEHYDLQSVDLSFLKAAEDADDAAKAENEITLDKMIKSQQSKRSRAKSKAMTQDNYNTLMVGAIAENLLRIASGKEKTGSSHSGVSKPIEYSEEKMKEFATDKEKLNKEIRNIQSKKSIMKSKANFDEKSDSYQALLDAETTLKALRGDTTATVRVVVPEYTKQLVEIKEFVESEVATKPINNISLKDAKELLTEIVALMSQVTLEEPKDENDEVASTEDAVNE